MSGNGKPVGVAVLGLGNVGSEVVRIIEQSADDLAARVGAPLALRGIGVRRVADDRGVPVELLTDNIEELVSREDVDIVVEVMGPVEPSRKAILAALEHGKSVVTANKALLATSTGELAQAAENAHVDLYFEAAVAGAIPVIRPLTQSLAGDTVVRVAGIVNGTTNYILTKMTREGSSFDEVLAEAQKLGYAESDPTSDVDGFDSMYKLAILASIAFSTPIRLENIQREGIRGVTARDIEYARELGHVIKLVALARQHDDGSLELRVHPALLDNEHPLANVNEVFNAVLVRGDAVGDVMFYGRGAGAGPTGSAVVGDLIEAARNIASGGRARVHHEPTAASKMRAFADFETRFYVRTQVPDQPGMLAQIATTFGQQGVSLESIVQKKTDGGLAEIVWMTHRTAQRNMDNSLAAFKELEAVREVSALLRVEGD